MLNVAVVFTAFPRDEEHPFFVFPLCMEDMCSLITIELS